MDSDRNTAMNETQLRLYRSYVSIMTDPNQKDENKLHAAQEINDNMELIMNSSYVTTFLEHMLRTFTRVIFGGQPQYISENGSHKIRKLIFEIIYRIPHNECLATYVDPLMTLCVKILAVDNEEVVLVGMRIISELLKDYRPNLQNTIHAFTQFSHKCYSDLPEKMDEIFIPKISLRLSDIRELDLDSFLVSLYYPTTVEINKNYNIGGSQVTLHYTILPKGCNSLKVLQELPALLILLYQMYRDQIKHDIQEVVPVVINVLCLKPSPDIRSNPNFSVNIYVEFLSAQVKTLSFIAYVIKVHCDYVGKYAPVLIEGLFNCFSLCPKEVTSIRRDLIIGLRHIFASELRIMFVNHMDKIFDENLILKDGFTTNETLRPLAYSTIADFVHHVRQHISMANLLQSVKLYTIILHDDSISTSIQVVAGKLLLNVAEYIKSRADTSTSVSETILKLLAKITKVLVLKFKSVANTHIPYFKKKGKIQQADLVQNIEATEKYEDAKYSIIDINGKKEKTEPLKMRFGHPIHSPINYTIFDTKSLIKALVCGIKMCTHAMLSKPTTAEKDARKPVKFYSLEPKLYSRFIKYACICFEIYLIPSPPNVVAPSINSNMRLGKRSKDDLDIFDHFIGVFTVMPRETFRAVFFSCIEDLIDQFATNNLLFMINESLLMNKDTCTVYGSILLEYLLSKLKEMGEEDQEKSNLHLKLFKSIFDIISNRSAESDALLRPLLSNIVNRSIEYSLTAKEPFNYFALLRFLFRSIGGGNHDHLYQEFLPLLPNLLQNLNSLQASSNKVLMRDMFIELCLTVPVRLSSLLPYFPMLMDPLVSAFNGSAPLISQGLRTLELCVDNLQPEFFYDHIQPIRADLMRGLWRSLHNTNDQIANAAFRVLGKLGGGNRKMFLEQQCLKYTADIADHPEIKIRFINYPQPIAIDIRKVIETIVAVFKSPNSDSFSRQQCWEVLRGFLIASLDLNTSGVHKFLLHPCFTQGDIPEVATDNLYKCGKIVTRSTHLIALTGMFIGTLIKELVKHIVPTMITIARHYTMVAIAQQAGPFPVTMKKELLEGTMDPLVLVDAIATIMGSEEKDLCKPGQLALTVIVNTATCILGSKERASKLPLMEYIAEKLCGLCFDRPWFTKLGGCMAIKFLCSKMEIRWVFKHIPTFVKAQLFIMMDLYGEVSNGAVDQAKINLREMIKRIAQPVDPAQTDLVDIQNTSLSEIVYDLTRQITSSNDYVREEVVFLLRIVAEKQGKQLTKVIECHKQILVDMIPPRKYYLRHQSVNAQVGVMEGTAFCTSLNPRLFSIDLSIVEHKTFFQEVCHICESTDAGLTKFPCYKSVTNFVPIRKAAMRFLAACAYIPDVSERIFNTLYQCFEKSSGELQKTAFESLKKFLCIVQVDPAKVHEVIRPLLTNIIDYRNVTYSTAQRMCYVVQLFPGCFKEKLCEQMITHMKQFFDDIESNKQTCTKLGINEVELIIATMMNIMYYAPISKNKFSDVIIVMNVQYEKRLNMGMESDFKITLLKFLSRFPSDAINMLIDEKYFKEYRYSRCLVNLLKHKNGKVFRDAFIKGDFGEKLLEYCDLYRKTDHLIPLEDRMLMRYSVIQITSVLTNYSEKWLYEQRRLINCFLQIWTVVSYFDRWADIFNVPHATWNEPKLIGRVLMKYFSLHLVRLDLLFFLTCAFSVKMVVDFQFLRDYLEEDVCKYPVKWKRAAFMRYCDLSHMPSFNDQLKVKILQYIIIPCFTASFEAGEAEQLIVGVQGVEPQGNLVTLFLTRLVEKEKRSSCSDILIILLQQIAILFVQYASHHLSGSKTEDNKLRVLMEFVWPCLNDNKCSDSIAEYHGYLLLSHIISKMAINKKIILQVFRGLLKANSIEVRNVVKQGLDLLAPVLPTRMDDGYLMLAHWTKKIIMEEGHCPAQLTHVLSFIVRQYQVYYPVRHRLIHHLVNSTSRLNVINPSNCEYRKLSVDIAEVIIKWELMRIRDDAFSEDDILKENMKRLLEAGSPPQHRKKLSTETGAIPIYNSTLHGITKEEIKKPLERQHLNDILNYLIKLPCTINDVVTTSGFPTANELLSRRCIIIIKTALKSDIWPYISTDLQLAWMDQHLVAHANNSSNAASVCVALEIITVLINSIKKEDALVLCNMLKNGIIACIVSGNLKVIRHTSCFLSCLINTFPIEPTSSSTISPHEELHLIYDTIIKTILDGMSAYECVGSSNTLIYCPVILLKAGCSSNSNFVDRFSSQLVRVLQRLAKEYLIIPVTESIGGVDLLITSLRILKNRITVMKLEARKTFIGVIMPGLIETATDVKVLRSIFTILEEWINTGKDEDYYGPNIQEKTVLLVKMIQSIEKCPPDLNVAFLDLIHQIYTEELSKPSELLSKLEQAFLAGLRSNNSTIRSKFFDLLDNSIQRKLIYRLLYIVSSQNWEGMSRHYWIKQALELTLVTAEQSDKITLNNSEAVIPSITSVIEKGSSEAQKQYQMYFENENEPMDVSLDEMETEIVESVNSVESDGSLPMCNSNYSLSTLMKKQQKFSKCWSEYKTSDFLKALSHLCHADTSLAEHIWLCIFPQIWNILSDRERLDLMGEIPPFIASGIHVIQKDSHPSAVCTFYEGLSQCKNPVVVKPHVMLYMAKNHNLWHRVALTLEKASIDHGLGTNKQSNERYEFAEWDNITQQEIVDSLADLYDAMSEEDMMCGLWQKHAKFTETIVALTYEQQGCFEQALGAYELVVGKARQTYATVPSPVHLASEQILWEKHWIRCTKELNQWDHLLDYAQTIEHSNPALILESAWRVPDWNLMKDVLSQVDIVCPGSLSWKLDLYKGYLAIYNPQERQLHLVERLVEQASVECIQEWRRLPRIVSTAHIKLLQAAQRLVELQESYIIHDNLLHDKTPLSPLHDMKSIVKTWRNRLSVIGDDLSHWSDIFTWRQHNYHFITTHCEEQNDSFSSSNSILGVHASAQAIIHFGSIARKHNLGAVCLDTLTRLYTIPSVPIVDCFQKILQQVKCYQQMSLSNGISELQEALDAIEYTNMRYLTREMTAECYALKGMLLSQLGNLEDANKSFSTALQLHDTLVKGWALWGDFMEDQFVKATPPDPMIGCSAILCFLNACKHQNESKARKYIAKIIWLITYDNEKCTLTELLDKHSAGVAAAHWLPWVPQLLTCLARKEGSCIINLITQIGKLYPQAIYFPTRTLYFTHKIEQRERFKTATFGKSDSNIMDKSNVQGTSAASTSSMHYGNSGQIQVKASHAMVNYSKIMQLQREMHPTVLLSLEGIVDQMVWFREHWSEEVLRQLKLGLAKSYALAFEQRGCIMQANISTSTHNFLKKLVSTFGTGLEIYSSSSNAPFSNAGSESLARRTQMTISDPVFQKMKQQFADDFDFNVPTAKKLQNFISKLRKWIKILEKQVQALPKSFRMEEKCRFLINFSSQTADIELPGEFLLTKHHHYYVRIARFVPRIEVVEKHNTATRRLYIRGHNGKIYPYLIMQESAMADARREETVLQLMRMLNLYLTKQKETSRRGLMFNVPKVVAVSPQLRLVEDNLSSLSLLDVYKRICKKKDMQYDEPIIKYYERLTILQANGGQTNIQVLKDILREIQTTNVPPSMFRQWANDTYKSPTDYWMLRKILTLQISLSCFVEYVFHLTRLNPDMIYLHQDSGYLNISYFRFEVDDIKGEVDASRAVPFRLTPNLTDFISEIGVCGPLIASMIATAKCFAYPNFQVHAILRALLRDEMIGAYKRKQEESISIDGVNDPENVPGEAIIVMVIKSVNSMMNRLNALTDFDGLESKVETLVTAARSVDNLCRMDPTWHPWL